MTIPKFVKGKKHPSALSANDMNVLADALRALVNPSIKRGNVDGAFLSDGNFVIQIKRTSAAEDAGQSIKPYLVDSVARDYITGYELDQNLAVVGGLTKIAKPWKLRVSRTVEVTAGVTYNLTYDNPDALNPIRTKTVDGESTSEDEQVTPLWSVDDDDIVFAQPAITGVVDGDSNPITLLLTSDSRAWCAV